MQVSVSNFNQLTDWYEIAKVVNMSDVVVLVAHAQTALTEIGRQADALATGLQNVAPGDKTETPNASVEYLFKISEVLATLTTECAHLLDSSRTDISKSFIKPSDEK